MNNREDILADYNALKVLVWFLWGESHGSIKKNDWNELKKEVIREMRKKWDKQKKQFDILFEIYYINISKNSAKVSGETNLWNQ